MYSDKEYKANPLFLLPKNKKKGVFSVKSKYTKEYAWEVLMRENDPLSKTFDSGVDGVLDECRTCRFHRPYWKYDTCVYEFCPYSEEPIATRRENLKEVK